MRPTRRRALYLCIFISMSVNAQAPSSPEAALEAHQQARKQKDLPRYLATISFQQEAVEELRRIGREPTDAAVAEVAAKRESQLRTHVESRGFIPDYGDCKVVRKLEDSDTQVRFILSCVSSTTTLMYSVLVVRFPSGWFVVRNG